LLRGFFAGLGIADGEQQALVLREIDKIDKRGADAVRATLVAEPFALADAVAERIMAFVQTRSTSHADALAQLDALDNGDAVMAEGRAELREVLQMLQAYGVPEKSYALNFAIARGLDYYTGTVYETVLDDHPQIGSVCSGGRYENLASSYTKSKLPGVGISIGLTRLFFQLRDAGIVSTADSSVQALVGLMDDARLADSLDIARRLRGAGISTEVQLEPKKLAKQFQYADRAGIRFVLLYGDDEAARGVVKVKDLRSQEQFDVGRDELAAALKVELEQQRAMEFTR
jgi:histidyl-tRNA synthetase